MSYYTTNPETHMDQCKDFPLEKRISLKMQYFATYLIFLVTFSSRWCLPQASLTTEKGLTRIGVILDQASTPGKEAKVAIEIAIQEFNNETNQSSVLYLQSSRSKPTHAAIAG